jgi:hypothetical protein
MVGYFPFIISGLSCTETDMDLGTPLHWSCYAGNQLSSLYLFALIPNLENEINK